MTSRLRAALLTLGALVAVLLLSAGSASSTVMRFMSLEELTSRSTDVVRGTVLGQSVRWTENREGILTYVDLLIHERLKGTRPIAQVVQLVQSGGELEGRRMRVVGLPEFQDGEEVVLFLAPYSNDPREADHVSLIGGRMGRLPVIPDPAGGESFVVRELSGLKFAEFEEERGESRLRVKPGPPDRAMRWSEFRARVVAAQSQSTRGKADRGGRP